VKILPILAAVTASVPYPTLTEKLDFVDKDVESMLYAISRHFVELVANYFTRREIDGWASLATGKRLSTR
jgi:hypothetical protein